MMRKFNSVIFQKRNKPDATTLPLFGRYSIFFGIIVVETRCLSMKKHEKLRWMIEAGWIDVRKLSGELFEKALEFESHAVGLN
jgi:hypothetical protein